MSRREFLRIILLCTLALLEFFGTCLLSFLPMLFTAWTFLGNSLIFKNPFMKLSITSPGIWWPKPYDFYCEAIQTAFKLFFVPRASNNYIYSAYVLWYSVTPALIPYQLIRSQTKWSKSENWDKLLSNEWIAKELTSVKPTFRISAEGLSSKPLDLSRGGRRFSQCKNSPPTPTNKQFWYFSNGKAVRNTELFKHDFFFLLQEFFIKTLQSPLKGHIVHP